MQITKWDGKPITKPGFYAGIPDETYHADPVAAGSFSSTQAKQILKSAAHLRHYLDSPRVEKKAFGFGHLVHAGVLGVGLELRVIPDSMLASNGAASTTAAKQFIAKARLENAVPLKEQEVTPIRAAIDAVRAHELAGPIFAAGTPEVSAFAIDPGTGLWLRARYDWVTSEDTLVDLKTVRDGESFAFEKASRDFGYDLQGAFYQHVYRLVTGEYPAGFRFVTVENAPPHLVDVHEGDLLWEQRGRQLLGRALVRYKAALDTGLWPGREPVINTLSVPNYLIEEED